MPSACLVLVKDADNLDGFPEVQGRNHLRVELVSALRSLGTVWKPGLVILCDYASYLVQLRPSLCRRDSWMSALSFL